MEEYIEAVGFWEYFAQPLLHSGACQLYINNKSDKTVKVHKRCCTIAHNIVHTCLQYT